jgi:hypothetical protein
MLFDIMILRPRQEPEQISDAQYAYDGGSNWCKRHELAPLALDFAAISTSTHTTGR